MNETTRSMMGAGDPHPDINKANDELVKAQMKDDSAKPESKNAFISHRGIQFQIYTSHTTVFIGDTVITLNN